MKLNAVTAGCLTIVLCLLTRELRGMEPRIPDRKAEELLEFTAAGIKANRGKVRTWQGRYDLSCWSLNEDPLVLAENEADSSRDSRTPPEKIHLRGKFLRQQQTEGEFVADLEGNRLYATYNVVGDTQFQQVDGDTQHSVTARPESRLQLQVILTPEEYLHTDQNARFTRIQGLPDALEPQGGYRMVYREAPEIGHQQSRMSTVFDPRRMLETGGRKIDFILKTLSTWIADNTLDVAVTRIDDQTFTVRYEYDTGESTTCTLTQQDDQLLPTRCLLEHPRRGAFEDSWEYRRESEVMVPVVCTNEHRDVDGIVQYRRTARLRDVRINEPVTDDLFDISRFNMGQLDRLVDKINGDVRLFLDKATVVSTGELREDMIDADTNYVNHNEHQNLHAGILPVTGSGTRHMLIFANLGLITLIATTMCWQRLRAAA